MIKRIMKVFLPFARAGVLASLLLMSTQKTSYAGDLDVNGLYYQKIVNMKDLIADILPPPAYIIESYLTVLQLVAEAERKPTPDKAKIDALIEYGRKLKDGKSSKGEIAGYQERIDFWKVDLKDIPENKILRNLLLKKSYDSAKKFYEIRDKKFVPAIKAGKAGEAFKIVSTELRPAYEAHRIAIDELVKEATKIGGEAEKEATDKLAKGETGGDLRIKGKLYNRIIQLKDLVSDILPPPRYIIESLLVVHQMVGELEISGGKVNEAVKKLIAYGKLLKSGDSSKGEIAGYVERKAYWVKTLSEKTLPEKKIKELMIKSSDEPAMKFYDVRDSALVPAIEAGNLSEAKKIVAEQLTPLYDEHRKHIDDLVTRSDKQYKQLEGEVAQQLQRK